MSVHVIVGPDRKRIRIPHKIVAAGPEAMEKFCAEHPKPEPDPKVLAAAKEAAEAAKKEAAEAAKKEAAEAAKKDSPDMKEGGSA